MTLVERQARRRRKVHLGLPQSGETLIRNLQQLSSWELAWAYTSTLPLLAGLLDEFHSNPLNEFMSEDVKVPALQDGNFRNMWHLIP